jgi:hypothetical protein
MSAGPLHSEERRRSLGQIERRRALWWSQARVQGTEGQTLGCINATLGLAERTAKRRVCTTAPCSYLTDLGWRKTIGPTSARVWSDVGGMVVS